MRRLLVTTALFGIIAACAAASEPATPAAISAETVVVETAELAGAIDAAPSAYAPAPAAGYLPASYADNISCDIDVRHTRGGVSLEAQAFGFDSRDALEYDFVVTKSGPGGDLDIQQGGEISEPSLGAVELNMASRDRYRARLVVSDAQGEVCRTEVRS